MAMFEQQIEIFNSHPHKEDDFFYAFSFMLPCIFNSHPHKEDDLSPNLTYDICRKFSTHILTRRMTLTQYTLLLVVSFFNSHPHKEDDDCSSALPSIVATFQLTSSQGG